MKQNSRADAAKQEKKQNGIALAVFIVLGIFLATFILVCNMCPDSNQGFFDSITKSLDKTTKEIDHAANHLVNSVNDDANKAANDLDNAARDLNNAGNDL